MFGVWEWIDSAQILILKNVHVLKADLQERVLWGGLGVDGRTILEWTLKR